MNCVRNGREPEVAKPLHLCHSEHGEESLLGFVSATEGFLAALGMTKQGGDLVESAFLFWRR